MTEQNITEQNITEQAPRPGTTGRARTLTVAALVTAGLAGGGAWAATASAASGSSATPSTSSSASAPAVPAPGGRGPRAAGAYDLDGYVTSASSTSITVKNLFGTSKTYRITSRTAVHSGPGVTATVSSLVDGEHVTVHATKSGTALVAQDIDLRAPQLEGAVTAVSGDAVTITDIDGFTRRISLSSTTRYTKDGVSASRSALTSGAVVRAEGHVDADGTTLDATGVAVITKASALPAGPGAPGGAGPGARPGAPAGGGGPAGAGRNAPGGAPTGAPKAPRAGAPGGLPTPSPTTS